MRSAKTEDQYMNYFKLNSEVLKRDFKVVETNGIKRLIWDEERNFGMMYRRHIENKEYSQLWVFNAVKRSFKKYYENNPQIEMLPNFTSNRIDRNNILTLKENETFYLIDAQHSYWRCAYLLGYINEKLYNKLSQPDYKLVRNKALSCTTSEKRVLTYKNGELDSYERFSHQGFRHMYSNIRNLSYKLMDECYKVANMKGSFLKYKTDGIYVKAGSQGLIEAIFVASQMLPKITECTYIGKLHYFEGDELKSF